MYEMAEGVDKVPEAKAPEKPAEQVQDEDAEPELVGEKPAEPVKAAETAKPPLKASDLRKAYDASKAKVAELIKENAEIKAKMNDPAKEAESLKLVNEKLAAAEKRLADYETETQFTNYEKSAEYREKYYQPYVAAYAKGREWVGKLTIENEDAPRRGTAEDFDKLMASYVNDPGGTMKVMEQMFGTAQYPSVLKHVQQVEDFNEARVGALEKFKTEGKQKLGERQTQAQSEARRQSEFFKKQRESDIEKKPAWFKPIEGDPEHAAMLERGRNDADFLFNLGKLKDENGQPVELSVEEKIAFHAAAANKVAAFDGVVYRLGKARAELKELRQKLKEYEASEPVGGRSRRVNGNEIPSGGNTIDGVWAELNKRARPV